MRILPAFLLIAVLGTGLFLFFLPRLMVVQPAANRVASSSPPAVAASNLPSVPESESELPTPTPPMALSKNTRDIESQPHLAGPPEIVKGIYVTGWSAGSPSRINSLISLAKRTEINAMVIDIKDFSGHVSYRTGIPEVAATGAEGEIKILQPNALLKKLHDAGIYVIARQTVFQDPILAKAHPEWALHNASNGKVWTDKKGLAWMDAAAKPVWEYNVAIAKDALARGFDEVQFDYVRFASDGDLGKISYPFWDQKTPRHKIIARFFKYLRDNLSDEKISADLFGLATVDTWDDLGIGQMIEDAYKNFDYVSPMVYPSHYAPGTLAYKNPAKFPYEVVRYSMEKALARLMAKGKEQVANSSSTPTSSEPLAISHLPLAKLRPWLQDFDLGATYDANMVRKQIDATYDALANATSSNSISGVQTQNPNPYFAGWLLWNPANTYTEGALQTRN